MITDGQAVALVTDLLRRVAADALILDAAGRRLTVLVFDGPDQSADYAQLWLSAGTPWAEDQQPLATLEELVGAGRRPVVTHTVACSAYAAGSDVDLPEWRRQAGELLAAVRSDLARDRTLSGRVALARLGVDRQMGVIADTQGAAVMCGFSIELVCL